jgi:predicted nucleotidyltransferase
MVSRRAFAETLRILLDRGFRFTVIGGSVIEYTMGSKDLGDDIDLFVESPSAVFEESYYRIVAEENGWALGYTWLGTPRIIARIGDEEVPVEFYENIHDFYIPPTFIERSVRVDVEGIRVRMIQLEDHIALKASSGRGIDMERLKEIGRLIKRGKLVVNREKLLEAVSEFEDREVIIRRLKETSII